MSENVMKQGVLVRGFGGFYVAVDGEGAEHILRCKKKFRRMHISPLVGDELLFTPGEGEEHGWVEEILPRRSECLRPPVANVSLLLVVQVWLAGRKRLLPGLVQPAVWALLALLCNLLPRLRGTGISGGFYGAGAMSMALLSLGVWLFVRWKLCSKGKK